MKHVIAAMALLLGTSALAPAAAEIEIHEQQGVRYVTGGMNDEENTQLNRLASRFPVHMVFTAAGQQEPLSGVQVTVRDVSGNLVLQARSEGPLMFADVPGGRYTVEAEYDGEVQSETKDLTGRRYLRLRFTFGE